eukprot:2394606-Amphidinium_carterae.1
MRRFKMVNFLEDYLDSIYGNHPSLEEDMKRYDNYFAVIHTIKVERTNCQAAVTRFDGETVASSSGRTTLSRT